MSIQTPESELERLLRATLTTRADAVTSGPAWQRPAQLRRTPPHRFRSRMLMPLAAAAAVAAVAVTLSVAGGPTDRQAPATQPPTSSRTGAPSSAAPTSSSPHTLPPPAEACAATLPDAWSSALQHAALPVGGMTPEVLSMAPDGTVVALRDNGPLPGSSRQVVLLTPGQAPRTVYTVADPDRLNVQSAQVSGHWLVVAVKDDGRPGPNTIPGSSPMPNVRKLVVVDLRSGATKQIAATPDQHSGMRKASTGAYVIGGVVYWDTRPRYAATNGAIHSYDLATGAAKVVYRGNIGHPAYGPAGVIGGVRHGDIWMVRAPLPPAVAADLTPGTAASLATDGTNFAWLETRRVLAWWGPGQSAPVRIQLRHPLPATDEVGALAVSGRFVATTSGDLVDTVSRASAPISGATVYAGDGRGYLATGAGDYLAGQGYPSGSGHYVNGYWEDPAPTVLRVKAASLPALTC